MVVHFATSRSLTPEPYEEGVVTLVHPAGFNNRIEDHTPLLEGNEFAVSGAENIDLSFSTNPTAFGIWLQDAFAVGDLGGCQGADSRFEFTFIRGATAIAGLTVDPPVDEAFFYGVLLGGTFDQVEIREDGSSIDDLFDPLCENDFFGSILLDDAT